MKKILLSSCFIAGVLALSVGSSEAIELKAPNVSAIKSAAPSATRSQDAAKSAANAAYQKKLQENLVMQKKALNSAIAYDKQARLGLAKVILSDDKIAEINKLKGEEQDLKLNEYLAAELTDEGFVQTYAEYSEAKKAEYLKAVTEIQIANNRYKNVSNQLTAPLKQIVDGNVSAMSAKEELKNIGSSILGIKKDLNSNQEIRKVVAKANKNINKANKENGGADVITIVVPENERVIYPKEGTIGSINAQLDEIDYKVKNANKTIGNILLTKEQKDSIKAIQNNPDLTAEEKNVEMKKAANDYIKQNNLDGTISKRFDSLTAADKKAYTNASQVIYESVSEYTALALVCTKLGFNISKNPLIAAPLVFEVGALKDTASLVRSSASDLAKSVSQIKKINSANGIVIETTVKNNSNNKMKNVNLKSFTK